MRIVIKILVAVAALGVLVLGGVAAWIATAFPKVSPAPQLAVKATSDSLARGAYLFRHVAACVACHSLRDANAYACPVVDGSEGQGGETFGLKDDVPGTIYAPNLTPYHLGSWSDGEVWRAIACGVDKDGRALFPLMPYTHYRDASREDLDAIVAYVRTLPSIPNNVRPGSLTFPMSLIVRVIPQDAQPPERAPDRSDETAYGRYLTNVAACIHCHSPSKHGTIAPGDEYIGGVKFTMPGGTVVWSANLTPDAGTFVGSATREQFVARFQALAGQHRPLAAGEINTPMPWTNYGGMRGEDLGAIWAYLRTLKPVANAVPRAAASAP